MRAAQEQTQGAHERDLPVRPPTESELMAMSRRHLSTDGPQNQQASFHQIPRPGASASRLIRNDVCCVSFCRLLIGCNVVS